MNTPASSHQHATLAWFTDLLMPWCDYALSNASLCHQSQERRLGRHSHAVSVHTGRRTPEGAPPLNPVWFTLLFRTRRMLRRHIKATIGKVHAPPNRATIASIRACTTSLAASSRNNAARFSPGSWRFERAIVRMAARRSASLAADQARSTTDFAGSPSISTISASTSSSTVLNPFRTSALPKRPDLNFRYFSMRL